MNTNLKSLILLLASGVSFSMESNAVPERENKYNKGQSPSQPVAHNWNTGELIKELVSDKGLLKTDISPSSFKMLPTGGNDLSLLCSIFGKKKGDSVTAEIDDDLICSIFGKKKGDSVTAEIDDDLKRTRDLGFKVKTFNELKQHVLDRIREELSNPREYPTVTTGDIVSINHTVRNLMEEGLARAQKVNPSEYRYIDTAEGFIDKLKTTSDFLPPEIIPVLNIIFPSLSPIVLMTRKDNNYVPQLYLLPNNTKWPIFIYHHDGQAGSYYSRMDRRIIKRPKTISQLVKK